MIQVFNAEGKKIAEAETSIKAEVSNARRDCMIYVDYIQGSEDNIVISFETKEATTKSTFPIQVDNGTAIVPYRRTLTRGKYRIYLPMAENEEALVVNITMQGDTSSPGTVKVWVIPTYHSY